MSAVGVHLDTRRVSSFSAVCNIAIVNCHCLSILLCHCSTVLKFFTAGRKAALNQLTSTQLFSLKPLHNFLCLLSSFCSPYTKLYSTNHLVLLYRLGLQTSKSRCSQYCYCQLPLPANITLPLLHCLEISLQPDAELHSTSSLQHS